MAQELSRNIISWPIPVSSVFGFQVHFISLVITEIIIIIIIIIINLTFRSGFRFLFTSWPQRGFWNKLFWPNSQEWEDGLDLIDTKVFLLDMSKSNGKIHTERMDNPLGQAWIRRKLKQNPIYCVQSASSFWCLLSTETFINTNSFLVDEGLPCSLFQNKIRMQGRTLLFLPKPPLTPYKFWSQWLPRREYKKKWPQAQTPKAKCFGTALEITLEWTTAGILSVLPQLCALPWYSSALLPHLQAGQYLILRKETNPFHSGAQTNHQMSWAWNNSCSMAKCKFWYCKSS